MLKTAQSVGGGHTALLTLAGTLRHRKGLAHSMLEGIIEEYQYEMVSLRSDVLGPMRTSIIGELMEDSCRTANMDNG